MHDIDPNRLKMWRAFSDLFLDTEIDGATLDYIARVVVETGYSAQEVQDILWSEVYPVLHLNLKCVAGEWAGWSDEWLLQHLRISDRPAAKRRGIVAAEIARCWDQVEKRLPPDFT